MDRLLQFVVESLTKGNSTVIRLRGVTSGTGCRLPEGFYSLLSLDLVLRLLASYTGPGTYYTGFRSISFFHTRSF